MIRHSSVTGRLSGMNSIFKDPFLSRATKYLCNRCGHYDGNYNAGTAEGEGLVGP